MQGNKLKIVFAGSVGSGKTCAIESISDVEAFTTEERATDEVKFIKDTTTVALDYGRLSLKDGTHIHLYGTPGQERFNFMWEILAEGAIGVIIIINSSTKHCADELKNYLEVFSALLPPHALVVAVTHTDLWRGQTLEELRSQVNDFHPSIPVFAVDARESREVAAVIKALLYHIDPTIG